jgi:glycosyltransferase involved in cell wall biosynthesis
MIDLPLVSVIMPNYNYAKYLEKSIDSVIKKSYSNIELIIIDDASTDISAKILIEEKAKDSRIKILVNNKNEGVVYCRNKGIEISKGEFLCFLDPDDIWLINKVEIQVENLLAKQANLCFTDIDIIDGEDNLIKTRKHSFTSYTYKTLLKRNFVPHSSLMVKKELLGSLRYQEIPTSTFETWLMKKMGIKKIIHEDYVLLLNLFKNNSVKPIHINEALILYRVHANNYSGNYLNKLFSLYCIYKNTQGFNVFVSIYYTIRLAYFASLKNIS